MDSELHQVLEIALIGTAVLMAIVLVGYSVVSLRQMRGADRNLLQTLANDEGQRPAKAAQPSKTSPLCLQTLRGEQAKRLAVLRASARRHKTRTKLLGQCKKEEDEPSNDNDQCRVCFEANRRTHIAVPCGHRCVCDACSASLPNCPICRANVALWQRVYDS